MIMAELHGKLSEEASSIDTRCKCQVLFPLVR